MILGPLRHPRPLTAADLHLQMEKEQEAAVCWSSTFLPREGMIADAGAGQSVDS